MQQRKEQYHNKTIHSNIYRNVYWGNFSVDENLVKKLKKKDAC
jgi:hypothetical protein